MLTLIDRYIIRKFLTTFFFMLGIIMLFAMVPVAGLVPVALVPVAGFINLLSDIHKLSKDSVLNTL